MTNGYGQYCPLSLASELLSQRWTLLVVSRLMAGGQRFNELRRGLPQMSPTLLSKRLDQLERAGIVSVQPREKGRWREYSLTPAGVELKPLVDAMAVWGQRWARDMTLEDLDPAFLMWSMHTRVNTEALPPGRSVIEFSFSGAPIDCRSFWLVSEGDKVEMCLKDPGYGWDVKVRADLRVFIETWRGFRDFRSEIRAGRIRLSGPRELRKQFPDWMALHVLAGIDREKPGRERRLTRITGARSRP
ncbi:MAG: helix-turn-helix transcriptional regulator [Gemmatimonadetes bacterium]|nr:helix-turn-helix transcriptional regulator [Gemmatimonadota bacterium]NNM34495.1 helix-turn-helix transcriptional regulator [Gemmatimonadota bacterium]